MKNFFGILLLFISLTTFGQSAQDPVSWSVSSKSIGDDTYEVAIKGSIYEGFHVYSQFLTGDEGPAPTELTFRINGNFELVGEAEEVGIHSHFDPVWEMDIAQFSGEALFLQKIKALNPDSTLLSMEVYYMSCNEEMCFPPTAIDLEVDLKAGSEVIKEFVEHTDSATLSLIPPVKNAMSEDGTTLKKPINDCGEGNSEEKKGNWKLFLFGLLGGLVSLFTPCVFPMIPLTVSFFTKGGSQKGQGIAKALLYGLSIVGVYVALSIPFYFSGTDPEILNQISTSFTLNIIFFVIFLVFSISFFGYFELTLPSSWANKADKAADLGGFLGVVFMALVLAIVSFSCTGPLLGSVLAGSLKDGPVPITMAMLGFGVGLGLPFTIFAAFPSLLKSLPSSGGWLNSVKVVLGFIELGMALKFLSNADFVYRFNIVLRETFFLVWIILAIATAAYLFGFIKFPHDSPNQKISTPRKILAILFLAVGVYLTPGVLPQESQPWETSAVSGFPPSQWYSWYDGGEKHHTDYYEALEEAKRENKPLLVDFTGYACVNCRKMEENVWTDGVVEKILADEYVIVSLYVDDKVELPKELQGEVTIDLGDGTKKQKKIKTVGDKWATFESLRFKQVSQPYYVLLSPDEVLLTNPVAYTPDATVYAEWLQCGVDAFNKLQSGDINIDEIEDGEQKVINDEKPITWSFSATPLGNGEFEVTLDGAIAEGWHTYSSKMEMTDEGPLPIWITFEENENFELVGELVEENAHEHFDEDWEMDIIDFSDQAIFKQKIKVNSGEEFVLKGNINFIVCKDGACLPPEDAPIEITIKE